ncbi:MAG: hypothetical protein A2782_00450 [Candidatus Blackburnbacteria bacterium RIFCSPHIGHO2_01_FULL_43_15b]|uniref:Core-binding (CB) domain-containing protein n=1 Tax=Candidatus Blackburnbacteria bacterium RIFCSPHIGHO2_01_FULL_43_15b TaxID=1797513 RepID=A0A1G1UYL9_9BACT|nr:MAG: hypothetical protein A2782_00450 [Candidatus Blackburnbacteria bacterium RIFCSPHIGHO2_01_FULL_43_15b]
MLVQPTLHKRPSCFLLFEIFVLSRGIREPCLAGTEDILAFDRELQMRMASDATRARRRSAIKAYFHHLQEQGVPWINSIIHLPGIKVLRKPAQVMFTSDDIQRLLRAPAITAADHRDIALVALLYDTGLHIDDLLSCQTSSVTPDMPLIVETRSGQETFPLGDGTIMPVRLPSATTRTARPQDSQRTLSQSTW